MGAKFDKTKKYAKFLVDGIKKGYSFDGCTNAPDFDFKMCCDRHDYDYQDVTKSRAIADRDLRHCIIRKGNTHGYSFFNKVFSDLEHRTVAWIYWVMVRIFGGSHFRKKQDETFDKMSNTDLSRFEHSGM